VNSPVRQQIGLHCSIWDVCSLQLFSRRLRRWDNSKRRVTHPSLTHTVPRRSRTLYDLLALCRKNKRASLENLLCRLSAATLVPVAPSKPVEVCAIPLTRFPVHAEIDRGIQHELKPDARRADDMPIVKLDGSLPGRSPDSSLISTRRFAESEARHDLDVENELVAARAPHPDVGRSVSAPVQERTNRRSGGRGRPSRCRALGRVSQTTNPSRPGDGLGFATTYAYDALNRVTRVETMADASITRTRYSENQTTVTDQWVTPGPA
jgi:hypothetical protein